MNTFTRTALKAAFIALILSASPLLASDGPIESSPPDSKPAYLHAGIGLTYLQDAPFRPNGPNETFYGGFRMDVAVGMHIDEQWSAEFETGFLVNQLNTINGVSVSPREIDFYQFPFLANVIYHIPTGTRWTPYIGVGAGGMATMVDATLPEYHATDFTFAYQAQTGVNFQLNPDITLDFGYKFLGSPNHNFTGQGVTTRTEPFYTHAFMFSFTWQF